ncbi:carbohydrate ABC transporter permease [Ruania alkalisoli]|uniref:carbohydrate ABC transporter permease n=1 Tax=Ruania alkalisoli TaxID=2779775 RepID=UPI001FE29F7F|nr:carbohydrate ABC transporter permease [Ruania alkalisoli]
MARSVAWTILLVVSLLMLVPFLWMLLTALKTDGEIARGGSLLPQEWQWSNFASALEAAPFHIYARNSLLIAVGHTVMTLTYASAAGYALAKLRFSGAKWLFGGFLAAMMIPSYATIVPQFLMVRFMPLFGGNDIFGQGGSGWIDTWWALIIPGGVSAFSVFLFRQFFTSVPTELIEAARLDGLSEVGIFARISAPQVVPAFLTAGLLSFESSWNNFLWPLLVTYSEELRVVQVGLAGFRQETTAEWNLMMAGTAMATLPMVVIFLFAQKYFVQGFANVGIK